MGAKGVFLDARIPKELEGRMPYARCIKIDGSVHWSSPECSISPKEGLVVSDRLVTFNSPIARWVDLSKDHAVYALAAFSQTEKTEELYKYNFFDKLCNEVYPCRRIRLSRPSYGIEIHGKRLILPVSRLALVFRKQVHRL